MPLPKHKFEHDSNCMDDQLNENSADQVEKTPNIHYFHYLKQASSNY